MLFNSLAFLIFFPIVVLCYWLLPAKGRWRNIMLLIASYYFYMNWQPVYALLILLSTVTTWGGALLMKNERVRHHKAVFIGTLVLNFGILFSFKYLNFFGDIIRSLMDAAGIGLAVPEFDILLPVGISFYTFQAVGYLIDVRRGTIAPERNLFTYALFVSFFPQLVAGPIERAKNLLPQFAGKHFFNGGMLIRGIELMVFGYFMKLCIADNVAPYVDAVFNNLSQHNGNSVALASFFFTFQILCDFGGYSLIAIGAARAMGFSLMQNFRQPYLATSIRDFWHRWHISLTTWFTDYIYIPMGGSRVSHGRHYGNIMTTFLVSGLWHGANYTFVLWGAYHGALSCIQAAWRKHGPKLPARISGSAVVKWLSIAMTFILATIGWIFFRANTVSDAFLAIRKIMTERGMLFNGDGLPSIVLPMMLIGLLFAFEILHERRDRKASADTLPCGSYNNSYGMSIAVTVVLLIIILLCGQFDGGQFIYFQF